MNKVLIVDDELLERDALKCMLNTMEEQITVVGEASDGEMAVTMADQLQPNLIFMDMKMPRMKGITAAKKIKQKHSDVTIYLMDLHIQRYEYQLDQYIDGFIEKPVRYQSLYKTINQYIYKTGHSLFSKNGPVEILLEQVQKENYRQAKECVNTFLDTFKKHTRPNMETIQQTIRILTDSMIKICEAKGIKEMVNIDHLGNVFTLNSAKTYLKSFLYEIFKALTAKQAKVGASNIQTVLNYIELYYMKGICLEDVANFVHLSPHYVSRLFKKEAKTTFINYVTERKIAHAKELLKNTDLSVVNIAMELSFQEHTYFSKVFKKYCGLTPTEYRKKVRDQLGQITHNWNQRKIDSWYI